MENQENNFNQEYFNVWCPTVTDDDVAEIARLSTDEKDLLKRQINFLDPRKLGYLDRQEKGIICPVCGNGSGYDGDGVTINFDEEHKTFWTHCFKCNDFEGDNYNKIVRMNNLNKSDFNRILAIGKKLLGAEPFNGSFDNLPPITPTRREIPQSELDLIKADIAAAKKCDIPEEDRRGISLDILHDAGCGYFPDWSTPKERNSPDAIKSTRIIIPTGDDAYVAILPKRLRNDSNKKWKSMFAGYKTNIFFLPSDKKSKIFLVVEGEFDALSIWQATKKKFNVFATGGTSNISNFIAYIEKMFPDKKKRLSLSFITLLDDDDAGMKATDKLGNALFKHGFPVGVDWFGYSGEHLDANDTLIKFGEEALSECVNGIIDILKPAIVETRDKISAALSENQNSETPNDDPIITPSNSKVRTATSQESLPSCPLDLQLPNHYTISFKGIAYGNYNLCHNPVIISKTLTDVESGKDFCELSFYKRKKWFTQIFPNKTISDHRQICELSDYVKFIQNNSKRFVKYFDELLYTGDNANKIPHCKLYRRTGWTDDTFSKFIYPDHLNNGDVLDDPNNMYRDKFTSKGDKKAWCKAIEKLFTNTDFPSPPFNITFGNSLAAPLYRILGLRNSQILLWCPSGKGKSAMIKIAMSIYGNPTALKNTFNATPNYITSYPAFFLDLPVWFDEFQSAKKDVREDPAGIIYCYADSQTRGRNSRDGFCKSVFTFYGVRFMTAEQPILNDNSDAGAHNRLLSISSDKLFPPNTIVADVHRFFDSNFGFFGKFWIDYISAHIAEIKSQFAVNQKFFRNFAKKQNWTNGWIDTLAAILTALQFAMPLIAPDAGLDYETVQTLFLQNFEEIEKEMPRESNVAIHLRALHLLEDYINEHPRFFKREILTDEGLKMAQSSEGNAFDLKGYQFRDNSFGFTKLALENIIQNDLGFHSAKAILRGWKDEGFIRPSNNNGDLTCRKRIPAPDNKLVSIIWFYPDVIEAGVPHFESDNNRISDITDK